MLDDWTRITIATLIGVGSGLGLGYFFGDYFFWVIISIAISIATESALRTIHNVKAPSNPILDQGDLKNASFKPPKKPWAKPPKPNF